MRVSGKILHQDYQQFVPMVEKQIEKHGSVRCYIEMIDFHGIELRALWDEIKFDVRHAWQIEALRDRRRSGLGSLDDQTVPAALRPHRHPLF